MEKNTAGGQTQEKIYKIVVNEVDCYKGNRYFIDKYASHRSVQHQICISQNDSRLAPLSGALIKPSDEGRFARIVFEKEVNADYYNLFTKTESIISDYFQKKQKKDKLVLHREIMKNLKELYKAIKREISFPTFIYFSIRLSEHFMTKEFFKNKEYQNETTI